MWQVEQDLNCPGCGHERGKSFDIETDGQWIAERITCHACAARDRATSSEDESHPGAYWTTRLP